jgi:hypothetical protein
MNSRSYCSIHESLDSRSSEFCEWAQYWEDDQPETLCVWLTVEIALFLAVIRPRLSHDRPTASVCFDSREVGK